MTLRPITLRPAAVKPPAPGPVEPLLDHLVYATPDLEATISQFRAATGVDPVPGGRHVGLGTRNVLVGLGPSRYLEIVGPDAEHPPDRHVTPPFGIADLVEPRLVAWAVHPPDIGASMVASAAAGADLGPLTAMRRARPDGTSLRWMLALTWPPPLGGVTPFMIDWGSSPHPSGDGLPQLDLLALRGTHPDPEAARHVLDAVGAGLPVERGAPGLRAIVGSPRGTVELS